MSKTTLFAGQANFFSTLLKESLSKTGVHVSLPVQNYLCQLLNFYIFSDRLFYINSSGKKQVKTLAELYLSQNQSANMLKSNLKKMGDTSLYMSGFFRESLKKKLISVDYYINMGQQAYQSLSDFQDESLFEELACRFSDLAWVLFQIRTRSSSEKYKDILYLLDQYMETGSSAVAGDLIKEGLSLPLKKNCWHSH